MSERARAIFDRLRTRVLEGEGRLDASIRAAAASKSVVPEALTTLVEKIHRHAYRVTDEDLATARAAGYSEDQLFELIVATAVGAADERFVAAMNAARPRN